MLLEEEKSVRKCLNVCDLRYFIKFMIIKNVLVSKCVSVAVDAMTYVQNIFLFLPA